MLPKFEKKLKKADDSSASLTSNLIFYLAAAPQHFGTITEFLAKYGLLKSETENWPRVVYEKPFGYDLDSAVRYNKQVRNFVPEENIYRIDHYLGKQMIQNIFVIRFANALFEPVWNRNHIDNIQIISTEKGGVKKRGKYYDEAGAMRDMMQSHLLQMLAMVSMEPPADMTPECIRREKFKIFKSLASPHPENIENELVLGQYVSGSLEGNSVQSYRDEPDIRKDSLTETFAAFKLYIDSLRWQGVPFYLKTGKRLAEKRAEIIVEFEPSFHPALEKNLNPDHSNILRMTVQPKEGVSLQFNAKKPGKKHKTIPVNMDFCQNCKKDFNSPAAYEEIFTGLFRGDQSLFTHWQEIKHSWQFIDNVKKSAEKADIPIISYDAGTRGPIEADRLLEKDGRGWWDKVKSYENL